MDGTHIAAKVPEDIAATFRNRKGFLSQNVLACCDFDTLSFTYVLAGTEGSAHDGAVLGVAFDKGFQVPIGKYYLVGCRLWSDTVVHCPIQRCTISSA
jgi:hypothetical protein